MALGFVTTRMFEAAVIAIGVVSLLTVVSLRQPGATGAEAHSLRDDRPRAGRGLQLGVPRRTQPDAAP